MNHDVPGNPADSSNPTDFRGIWVALATPFRNTQVDYPALRALASALAGQGIAGLVVCGSTGEAAALDDSEQLAVLDAVLDAVQDRERDAPRCRVIMGVGGSRLDAVREQMRQLASRPLAGVLVPAPHYIRPSQDGLLHWFRTLAGEAPAPLVIYNIPSRTGVAMSIDTLRELAAHPRIAAIKDCGNDEALTMKLIADGRLAVLAGDDHRIFSTLCLGGAGAIAVSAHVRPDLFVRMARAIDEGRLDEGRRLFFTLLPMIELVFAEPNPGPIKSALATMSLASGELRPPMQPPAAMLREALSAEIARLMRIA